MDIAKEARVSQATTSMILNKKRNAVFSKETVQRVMDTAEKRGYKMKPKNRNIELSGLSEFHSGCSTQQHKSILFNVDKINKRSCGMSGIRTFYL